MVSMTNGYVILDNAVTTAKIADNSVTLAKMADNSVGTAELVDSSVTASKLNTSTLYGFYTQLGSTQTLTAQSSFAFNSITAYDEYLLEFNLIRTDAGANENILVRLNSDSGANYAYKYINNSTNLVTDASGQTSVSVGRGVNTQRLRGTAVIDGKTAPNASGIANIRVYTGTGAQVDQILNGRWSGGNATQVTDITGSMIGTYTGTIKLWARNL